MSSPTTRAGEDDSGPDGQETLNSVIDPSQAPNPPNSNNAASALVAGDVDDDVAHFLSIPWCRAHLRPAETSPAGAAAPTNVRIVLPHARRSTQTGIRHGNPEPAWLPHPDGTPGGTPSTMLSDPRAPDTIFTRTLNTPDTIRAFILLYEEPARSPTAYRPPVVEVKALLTLGAGVNGHPGVLHGGIVATILDEVLGLLMPLNTARDRHNAKHKLYPPPSAAAKLSPPEEAAAASAHCHNGLVTGYLNTTYVKPVLTLASILVTARFVRTENKRKFYVEGSIWDENATLRAKAEAVFIALKQKL